MPPTRTQNTNVTPKRNFAKLGFPVVSRDEALAAATKAVIATTPKPPLRKKTSKRSCRVMTQSCPTRTRDSPPSPPASLPIASTVLEESKGETSGSGVDRKRFGRNHDLRGCPCGRDCAATLLTDVQTWRKPDNLPLVDHTAMEPECHNEFDDWNIRCDRCGPERQLDVGL